MPSTAQPWQGAAVSFPELVHGFVAPVECKLIMEDISVFVTLYPVVNVTINVSEGKVAFFTVEL
jgi:hypothetical protein